MMKRLANQMSVIWCCLLCQGFRDERFIGVFSEHLCADKYMSYCNRLGR
jgi:hypothetical protein